MLDLVFAVDSPLEWHEENLKKNRHHYSFLRYLGSKGITSLQKLSAGVYYNTLVNVDSQVCYSLRMYTKHHVHVCTSTMLYNVVTVVVNTILWSFTVKLG